MDLHSINQTPLLYELSYLIKSFWVLHFRFKEELSVRVRVCGEEMSLLLASSFFMSLEGTCNYYSMYCQTPHSSRTIHPNFGNLGTKWLPWDRDLTTAYNCSKEKYRKREKKNEIFSGHVKHEHCSQRTVSVSGTFRTRMRARHMWHGSRHVSHTSQVIWLIGHSPMRPGHECDTSNSNQKLDNPNIPLIFPTNPSFVPNLSL